MSETERMKTLARKILLACGNGDRPTPSDVCMLAQWVESESWPRVQVPASETTTHEVRHSPTSRSTHAGTVERCGLCNPTTATSEPNDWTPPEDHDCWICEKPDAGYRDVLGMWTHAECADRHDSAAAELFRTASQDSEKEGGEDGN